MTGRRAWARPIRVLCAVALALVAGRGETPASPGMPLLSHYAAAPFGTILVTHPARPGGTVLFLSDANGVTGAEMTVAAALSRRGMMVALLSTPALMRALDAGPGCLNLNYPLIALSSDVQHRMAVRTYAKPVIMGLGEGGALAYASLSQWARGSYAGILSIGYRPPVATSRPWCAVPGFTAQRDGRGWRFGPNPRISLPWVVLTPDGGGDAGVGRLVSAVPSARLATIAAATDQWRAPVSAAVAAMLPHALTRGQTGSLPIPDMPLTLVPARPDPGTAGLMAILYSGDGGWVGIDHDVAGALAAAGIPVVGVDSLSYFWTARTPEGAAQDLSRLIEAFSRHWGRPQVLLVGYSFGADVMPAMVERLSPAGRARIARLSLLGLSKSADFQFHLASWLNVSSDEALPTLPAIARLRGMAIQCVRGDEEEGSACPAIAPGVARQFLVPGDHHFNRNAPLLASIIMGRRAPGTVMD
ncbi:MAG: AcvB/VirJ family lysyl-phosphatidylglycerol hydrolase [Sphingobium sp.]